MAREEGRGGVGGANRAQGPKSTLRTETKGSAPKTHRGGGMRG